MDKSSEQQQSLQKSFTQSDIEIKSTQSPIEDLKELFYSSDNSNASQNVKISNLEKNELFEMENSSASKIFDYSKSVLIPPVMSITPPPQSFDVSFLLSNQNLTEPLNLINEQKITNKQVEIDKNEKSQISTNVGLENLNLNPSTTTLFQTASSNSEESLSLMKDMLKTMEDVTFKMVDMEARVGRLEMEKDQLNRTVLKLQQVIDILQASNQINTNFNPTQPPMYAPYYPNGYPPGYTMTNTMMTNMRPPQPQPIKQPMYFAKPR